MSRLSRQCLILNISQSYGSPRAVTGIVLLFTFFLQLVKPVRLTVASECAIPNAKNASGYCKHAKLGNNFPFSIPKIPLK
jgi:hypothetical protein